MASRLFVKNLPKYCDEKRLREFFGSAGGEAADVIGEPTDVKVVRK